VAVAANLAAFGWGRAAVADPRAFEAAVSPSSAAAARTVPEVPAALMRSVTVTGATRALVERRAGELVAYQNQRTATDYLAAVQRVWDAERRVGERTEFSEAVAQGLFTLMAYKDEYEVARLLTDPAFTAAMESAFPGAGGLTYRLHPPALRALGRTDKIGFGPRSHRWLRLLAKGKHLRGTVLDPFGHTALRRTERALIEHYRDMVVGAADALDADGYDTATAAASASELVRGYESVKVGNIDRYCRRLEELGFAAPELAV
jgi:indolepyruvate ferredoxin oxidoreductase